MEEQLAVVSTKSIALSNRKEIDKVIAEMIESSKKNHQDIQQLTLESLSLLTSAEARSKGLQNQKTLKRMWNNFTGKNDKVRDLIAQDTAAAQYAAQQTINRVLAECTQNRELSLAIYEHVNQCVLALNTDIIEVSEELALVRQAVVSFFQTYTKSIEAQAQQLNDLEESAGIHCPKCYHKLKQTQCVCPACGEIHPLKERKMEQNTRNRIQALAQCMQDDSWNPEVYWSDTAKRYAQKIHKAKKITKQSEIYMNASVEEDIASLIAQCQNTEFQIAVVGILKAGKSMLMNALIGTELAPTGLNSTTAALTKFRSSPQGHYVKVRFHSQVEWDKLIKSAVKAGGGAEDSFMSRLQTDTAQAQKEKWIGHAPVQEYYSDLPSFKEAISRWAAANSAEHLFVAELEVGIDRSLFDMPEEVVFVDTPGLEDPVAYRSDITKRYIKQANAVLVAIRPTALTVEGFNTITTVLDYAGGNKEKVYLIGTQKDSLQKADDYTTLIEGDGGWIEQLKNAKRYKNERELMSHIFTTSAYLHLCMNKACRLSEDEFKDNSLFSDEEYTNLESGVKKALSTRSYDIAHLRHDTHSAETVTAYLGIATLQKHLDTTLIQKHRQLKIRDIQIQFRHCKSQLQRTANQALDKQKTQAETAKKGSVALKLKQDEQADKLKMLQEEKANLEDAMDALKAFTQEQLAQLEPQKERK